MLSVQASEKKNRWVSGNYMFFRMHRISDIYFVGGFGTVQWVDVGDYVAATPDQIVKSKPLQTLQARFPQICSGFGHYTNRHQETNDLQAARQIAPVHEVVQFKERNHVQVLNESHSEGLRQALSRPKGMVDDAAFISIDRQGADVRVRRSSEYVVERLTFSTVSLRV